MASLAEVEAAFMKAHQAGDQANAKILAAEVQRLRAIVAEPGPTQAKAAEDPQGRTDMVRDQYAQMPWYQKPLQALDDVARFGLDTATFGGADKFSSIMSGTPIAEERQKTADARARSGGASTALDIAQAVKQPRLLGEKLGLFGLGADTALYSGAQSYGHGSTGEEAWKDAALGGGTALGLGGLVPAIRGASGAYGRTSPLRAFKPDATWGDKAIAASHGAHILSSPITGLLGAAGATGADALNMGLRSRFGQSLDEILKTGGKAVSASPTFRREDKDHVIRR